MKVIIDTEEKTFKLIGCVAIDELTEFVDSHGFKDYIVKIGADSSTAYDSDKVTTNDGEIKIHPYKEVEGCKVFLGKDGGEYIIPKL